MDKRALSAISRPALTDKNRELLRMFPHMCYLVTANRREVNGVDTLIINFFRAEKQELKPEFRTFCQPEDYITQVLTTEEIKWKTGAINHLTGYLYWHNNGGNIVVASARERKIMLEFLYEFKEKHNVKDYARFMTQDQAETDTELGNRIDEYQDKIKEWKLKAKHDKEKSEIDLQMRKFGGVPEDYFQFIKEKVFGEENYIFYSSAKKTAHCTNCGLDFELDEEKHLRHKEIPVWNSKDIVKHNNYAVCPYCNKCLKCKSEGMGRKGLTAVQWSVLVQKYEEEVLVRYFCHTKDFRGNYRKPEITAVEKFRTVHTAEKAECFDFGKFKNTLDFRWCRYSEGKYGGWCPPAETEMPRTTVLYNKNISEAISKTCMKYSAVNIYIDKILNNCKWRIELREPWSIDWYFNQYRKKPYLEQLLKIGFFNIVRSVMEDYRCPEFVIGRTVLETLGVNKAQFNMLRAIGNPSVRDVMILRYARKISQQEFDMLRQVKDDPIGGTYERYIDMRAYTTIYKVKKYIDKNGIVYQGDYFDYIKWLQELGYDMRNEFNLFPRKFKKAHDDKYREYIGLQDKKAEEDARKFRELMKRLRKEALKTEPMSLKIGGLFIRFPKNLDELKVEGEILHHCVGTYRDKVAKGESMIFFIRKEDGPDKPYYTMEWKGKVVQCRGFRNCEMTPEVKAFVEIFQEKMMEYEKSLKNQRKAV